MPVVTDIQKQQKDATRYSVYLDSEFAFGLSERVLVALGLHRGQELAPDEVERLRASAAKADYYDKAVGFISYRRRTRHELADYLHKKGADEAAAADVLLELQTVGLLDDAEFARSWVRDRSALKPRSRRLLSVELRAKGVDNEVINEVLQEYDQADELQAVQKIIKKKLARYPDQSQLVQYLLRQGFDYDVIKLALSGDLGPARGDESIG